MPLDPQKIKAIMDKKGISAIELSRLTGMDRSNVSRILNGPKIGPPLPTVERIAKALGCSRDKLCSD
jgi:transcriptional regulator with XRE-family HTH domain